MLHISNKLLGDAEAAACSSTLSLTELESSLSLHSMAHCYSCYWGFPGGSDNKESACNAGAQVLSLGLGRSPGERYGNSL